MLPTSAPAVERIMIMTVKDYLNRGYELQREIKIKTEQLENINEAMTNLTATLDGIKVMKTPTTSSIENGVVRVVELKEDISSSIARLAIIGTEAMLVIKKLGNLKTESILIKHYVGFKSWDIIAQEMNMARKTIINRHYYAILKLEEMLKDSPLLGDDDVA